MPASLLLSDSDDDGDLHLWKRRKRRKVARRKRESGDGDGDELRADMDGMTAEDRQFIDFEDEVPFNTRALRISRLVGHSTAIPSPPHFICYRTTTILIWTSKRNAVLFRSF